MSAELADAEYVEDETLWERRYRFLSMRNGGGTFSSIAESHNAKAQLNGGSTVSASTVRKDILAAKRQLIEESTRESMIAECQSVILDVRRANYAAMASGDPDASKVVLATVLQQREMFGLDSPKRLQIGVGTDVEFAESLASLMESVGYVPPSELLFAARGERPEPVAIESSRDVSVDGETSSDEPESERPPSNDALDAAAPWSNIGFDSRDRPHGATPPPA